ncbi:MAG: DMT family transporter [Methylocystis sp.]
MERINGQNAAASRSEEKSNIMTRMRADLILLLVAFIWGTSFIAQKHANETMGPISFVGVRFLLSWIGVAPLARAV